MLHASIKSEAPLNELPGECQMNIKAFFRLIAKIFKYGGKALIQVEDILPDALEIAKMIAMATPTRSDDEILALINEHAYGAVKLTDFANKGDVLRAVARVALQRRLRLKIRESVLNAAIDLAALEFNQ